VQLFRSYRVPELHEWARATDGRMRRRVRCVGERGEFGQEGAPTPVEEALGIPAMTVHEWNVNEHTVMKVAGAWSVDPQILYLTESSADTGLCGNL
jgi:hypothetical protein